MDFDFASIMQSKELYKASIQQYKNGTYMQLDSTTKKHGHKNIVVVHSVTRMSTPSHRCKFIHS